MIQTTIQLDKTVANNVRIFLEKNEVYSSVKEYINVKKRTVREKLNEQMKTSFLIKEVLTTSVLVSIMQIIVFMIMISLGILPPIYMDFLAIKLTIYGVISILGIYFKKSLFEKKKDFFRGMATTIFISALYQTNGFLIF